MKIRRQKHLVDRSVQGAIPLRLVWNWGVFVIAAGAFLYFAEPLTVAPREAGWNFVA